MEMNKPRVIKDYAKLDVEIQEQLKLAYPNGFSQNLIEFSNARGEIISALPFETDSFKYMIRMSGKMAKRIIDLDEDYNNDGILKEEAYDSISEKYPDAEYLSEEDIFD
jgi:hypothetical protein